MSSSWKPLNFYVFVTYDNLIENSLRIPIEFTKEQQKQILSNNNIILTVSDDKTWPMGWMTSCNGQLWLKNGWSDFAKHYRIKIGYLLLFNHLGDNIIHVRIFDRNSCEINYVPFSKAPESEKDIDQSVSQQMEGKILTIRDDSNFYRIRLVLKSILIVPIETVNTELPTEKGEIQRPRNRAPTSAIWFKSDYPFFSVTLKDSHFVPAGMRFSMKFCRRYLTSEKKCVDCVLQMQDGKSWGPIICKEYKTCGKLSGKNWKKFSDDNHLVVGDVCVFELMNEIEKVLNITIIRVKAE